MKFKVEVSGEAALGLPEQDFELDALDANHAVERARKQIEALAPKEGGKLEIKIHALEPWERVVKKKGGGKITETYEPGEVTRFPIELEPDESVRKAVEERRAAAERAAAKAAERAGIEAEFLEKLKTQGLVPHTVELSTIQGVSGDVEVSQ